MRRRIRTTRQARTARARALSHLKTVAAVEDGRLTAYETTRTRPSGGTWQQRWEHKP